MDPKKDTQLTREENLKAENHLLRLKLKLEYGMDMQQNNPLDPELENQWLNHVYAFEQQFKNARTISVYDYLGKPSFKPCETLSPAEIGEELKRIQVIMEHKDVVLDCICDYDDALIYKFITEELFAKEMDDMHVPGMVTHYIYEEFHPNHAYDLRRQSMDLTAGVFERKWNKHFEEQAITETVIFCGVPYDRAKLSNAIIAFQSCHRALEIEELEVLDVAIDEALTKGTVGARLMAMGRTFDGTPVRFEGKCSFDFVRQDDWWYVSAFSLPGFNSTKADAESIP